MTVMDSDQNKRESYRCDDIMTVRIRVLDEQSTVDIQSDFNAFRLRYSLNAHMKNQREQRLPRLQKIRKRDTDVAQYLEYLEMLILQLAERMDENTKNYADAIEFDMQVNLSATGARFGLDQDIVEGQTIELGMMLSTIDTQVVVLAEVIRVEQINEGGNSLSVQYTHIHPDDTEAIIRHLAKLQLQQLKLRRAG